MDNSRSDTTPGWFEARLPLCAAWHRHWSEHPVPANLTFVWSFGVLVAVALGVLAVSGIWLGFAYVPTTHGAAASIEQYTREVNFGWLIHDLHLDGTTMLFGVVYIELFRGLYYGSYRNGRDLVWIIEVFRFFVFLAVGFCGFAMTGGALAQASLTVMAAHIAAIPIFGDGLSQWFLAGFVVGPATAPRIAMLHEAIGVLVILIALLGYAASRAAKPANPDGIAVTDAGDMVPQSAYAGKVFSAFIIFAFIFALIITFAPDLGQPAGMSLTDPLSIPVRPAPPWYLLGFHGLARAGMSVGGGTLLTVAALILLGALPWLDQGKVASGRYRPVYAGFVILLAIDWIVLSVAAAEPAVGAWPVVIDITTIWLFVHFIIITPLVTMLAPEHAVPARIARRIA
ncbi:MAG TPA: cytochrome bc complex cytochrome b subunit [Acidiphilium sp.]